MENLTENKIERVRGNWFPSLFIFVKKAPAGAVLNFFVVNLQKFSIKKEEDSPLHSAFAHYAPSFLGYTLIAQKKVDVLSDKSFFKHLTSCFLVDIMSV
jgi:hypothetical protein